MNEPPPLQKQSIPRVYLAGKVGKNNFRYQLGLDGRDMSKANILHYHKRKPFVYSGPLIPSCDHGCWHYFFEGMSGYDGGFLFDGQEQFLVQDSSYTTVVASTIAQIQSSDFVFAWFDSYDAYGTIAEIGIAIGNKIPVYIGFQEDVFPKESAEPSIDWESEKAHLVGRELWYVAELAHQKYISSNVRNAFSRALRNFSIGQRIPAWKTMLESFRGREYPGE